MTKYFHWFAQLPQQKETGLFKELYNNKFRSRYYSLDHDKVMTFIKSNFHLLSESKDGRVIELSSDEELNDME